VRNFEHQISQLDPASPDYAQEAAKLQTEETKFSACRMSKTRGALPTDLQIRFELASFIFSRQNWRGHPGISEGASQSHRKAKAMSYLGQ